MYKDFVWYTTTARLGTGLKTGVNVAYSFPTCRKQLFQLWHSLTGCNHTKLCMDTSSSSSILPNPLPHFQSMLSKQSKGIHSRISDCPQQAVHSRQPPSVLENRRKRKKFTYMRKGHSMLFALRVRKHGLAFFTSKVRHTGRLLHKTHSRALLIEEKGTSDLCKVLH